MQIFASFIILLIYTYIYIYIYVSACAHTWIYMNADFWGLQLPVLQVLYVFGGCGGSVAGNSIYTQECNPIYSDIYIYIYIYMYLYTARMHNLSDSERVDFQAIRAHSICCSILSRMSVLA